MPALIWENMTVSEVREALGTVSTVLIPVGVTEQHGYHLPLCTDNQNAVQISSRASDATGCFVAPLLPYTYSGGELPGTINIPPSVVTTLLSEIIREFLRHGLRNVILVLGHGGSENDKAVTDACDIFLRTHPEYADRNLAVYRFWQNSPTAMRAFEDHDYHAGYFETALLMYWVPELVRETRETDVPEHVAMMRADPDSYQVHHKNVEHSAVIAHTHQSPDTRVGVIGDPSLATVELGKQISDEAVAGLVQLVAAMEGGQG
jgi:creatinine amidohydrolase